MTVSLFLFVVYAWILTQKSQRFCKLQHLLWFAAENTTDAKSIIWSAVFSFRLLERVNGA